MKSLDRLLAEHGDAAQQAALGGIEIGAGVQRAAIVPDQEIARPPDMLIDELRLLLMVEERGEQAPALLLRYALDLARHQAVDEQRLAAGGGMGAHDGMGVARRRIRDLADGGR